MASKSCLAAMRLSRTFFQLPAPVRQTILRSHLNRLSPTFLTRRASNTTPPTSVSSSIPPPTEASGPLMERLPNRALPDLARTGFRWTHTLPLFLFVIAVSSLAIFNYEKSSSSTVSSILYALRKNPTVREMLGDEIYFASQVPWISGELNPLQGNINISFWVKGTKAQGKVKFVSVRRKRERYFETLEWSLKTDDGREIQLLELANADDHMKGIDETLQALQ